MSEEVTEVIAYFNNHTEVVAENYQTLLDSDQYFDLVFVCQNKKKVKAHQIVLGCLSNFFYGLFVDNMNTTKENVLYIHVPDIRARIMKHILTFIYTGKAMLYKEELAEFNEDIQVLGMPLQDLTATSEASQNTEASSSSEPAKKSRLARIVKETVDLTDSSTNDDQEQSIENSNTSQSSSRVEETPAPATVPAALPTVPVALPTAPDTVTNNAPNPPLIDKNPPDINPSAKRTQPENRTASRRSSSSSDVTANKLSKTSIADRTTLKRPSSSSDVTSSNLLENSQAKNRTPTNLSNGDSALAKVPANESIVIQSKTTVPKVPESNAKKLPTGDVKKKSSRDGPPSKRGKYLASIDLDASDDDDVITLS